LIDGEARDFLVGQARAQRHAVQALGFLQQALETLAVARLDIDDLGQLVDRRVEIGHARRDDLERVGRIALGEHDAVAVGDQPAIGRDRHDGDAIAFGQRLVVAVLDDLQIDEAAEQSAEPGEHQHAGDQQEPAKAVRFALRILELGWGEGAVAAALREQTSHQIACALALRV